MARLFAFLLPLFLHFQVFASSDSSSGSSGIPRGAINEHSENVTHFSENISPITGNLYLSNVDARLPGNGGLDIEVIRQYSTPQIRNNIGYINKAINRMGYGWDIHFGYIQHSYWQSWEKHGLYYFGLTKDADDRSRGMAELRKCTIPPYINLFPTASIPGLMLDRINYLNGQYNLASGWEEIGNLPAPITSTWVKPNVQATDVPVLVHQSGNAEPIYNVSYDKNVLNSKDYSLITPSGWRGGCLGTSLNPGFVFYSPEGVKYVYNKIKYTSKNRLGSTGHPQYEGWKTYAWYLSSMTDKHGNSIFVEYVDNDKGQALVKRVYSSDGREVNFKYDTVVKGHDTYTNLKSLTYHGHSVSYGYDDNRNLDSVKYDGKTVWEYDYESYNPYMSSMGGTLLADIYLLKSYVNEAGGKVEYSYKDFNFSTEKNTEIDNSKVVSSKSFLGNFTYNKISYNYRGYSLDTNLYEGVSLNTVSSTDVVDEKYGCVRYFYNNGDASNWDKKYIVKKVVYNKRLVSSCDKLTSDRVRVEDYVWDKIKIGDSKIVAANFGEQYVIDQHTWAPALKSQKITEGGNTYITDYSNFTPLGTPRQIVKKSPDGKSITETYSYFTPYIVGNLFEALKNKTISDGVNSRTVLENSYYSDYTLKTETTLGAIKTFDWHSFGNIKKVTFNIAKPYGAGNRTVEFSNYKAGMWQTKKEPNRYDNGTSTFVRTVNELGQVTYSKNYNGEQYKFDYDYHGRIEKVDPVDTRWATRSVSYYKDVDGIFKSLESLGGYRKLTSFDGGMNQTQVKEWDTLYPSDSVRYSRSSFDHLGKPTFQSYPSKSVSTNSGVIIDYDNLGRVKSRINSVGEKESWNYVSGHMVDFIDAKSNKTTVTYLSYGSPQLSQPKSIQSPEGVSTSIDYDLLSNVTHISQFGGVGSEFRKLDEYRAYDTYNNLCKKTRSETGVEIYSHTSAGLLTSYRSGAQSSNPNNCSYSGGQSISYLYDNRSELRSVNYSDSSDDVLYTMDSVGNLTELKSGSYSWGYQYNSLGLVELETFNIDGKAFTLDHGYNSLGLLTSIVYPSGRKVDFTTNSFGQMVNAGKYVSNATYHANGMLDTLTYANGITYTTDLNSRQLPEDMFIKRGSKTLSDLSYSYDKNHNVSYIDDAVNSQYDISLTYDGLNRLKTASGYWGSGSFNYDALGNITSKTLGSHSLSYNYDSSNLLRSVTGSKNYVFGYDSRGNVTDNGHRPFSYNQANQMTDSNGISYLYDGHNRRVKKTHNGKSDYSLYSQDGTLLYRQKANGTHVDYIYINKRLVTTVESR